MFPFIPSKPVIPVFCELRHHERAEMSKESNRPWSWFCTLPGCPGQVLPVAINAAMNGVPASELSDYTAILDPYGRLRLTKKP